MQLTLPGWRILLASCLLKPYLSLPLESPFVILWWEKVWTTTAYAHYINYIPGQRSSCPSYLCISFLCCLSLFFQGCFLFFYCLSLVNDKDSFFISENEVTLWYECSTHPQAFHSGVFPWLHTIRTGCDSYVWCIHGGYCGGQWSCTLINCLSSHSVCIPLESIPPSAVDSWMFIFWNDIFAGKLASA